MIINHSYSIHKFGGSSLANAQKFRQIPSLLKGSNEIIVVSAIMGTTSALQMMLDQASSGLSYLQSLDQLQENHLKLIQDLEVDLAIIREIQIDICKIKDLLYAIYLTGSYAKDIQNLILGYGELWSAKILTAYLGQANKTAFLDAAKVLFTYEKDGVICIDWVRSKEALYLQLKSTEFNQLIITGFIAATLHGKRTILGRNGSDFSAAIFANLFAAKELIIWTDVDGIYTADPALVPAAQVIESLSYQEALELAYFGAKVLHPMTIAPLVAQEIPLYIKNSYKPEAKGTFISAQKEESSQLIKGLSCIEQVGLINIEGSGLIPVSKIASRVADIVYRAEINVLLISQASSEHSLCLAIPEISLDKAWRILKEELQAEIARKQIAGLYIEENCAILSVVGDQMIGNIGIAAKLCSALAKAGINISALSQGSSERNISVVIKNSDRKKALQAVHAGFYLSRKNLVIGLIGPGLVGKNLLQQIQSAINLLREKYQINLQVLGIMNSEKMLISQRGLELKHWQDEFQKKCISANLKDFIHHFAENVANSVIIDCTASTEIAQHYLYCMEKGIHLITPNKHANTADLAYYKDLQARNGLSHYYFYEATVCAGLPVISTLQDMIKTGDEINEIEGVVSGTLSYIFNEMARGKSFSEAVLDAKNRGFTEPDPREDLSGMDVARKLVCLAREIGHEVSLAEVEIQDLVPPELKSCSVQDFLSQLPAYDETMSKRLKQAAEQNKKLYYAGRIAQDGSIEVAIRSVSETHPFSGLEGSDNLLIFRTKRYRERPLIIQGPGAGAEVTAAGIFADLLRLVDVLS